MCIYVYTHICMYTHTHTTEAMLQTLGMVQWFCFVTRASYGNRIDRFRPIDKDLWIYWTYCGLLLQS